MQVNTRFDSDWVLGTQIRRAPLSSCVWDYLPILIPSIIHQHPHPQPPGPRTSQMHGKLRKSMKIHVLQPAASEQRFLRGEPVCCHRASQGFSGRHRPPGVLAPEPPKIDEKLWKSMEIHGNPWKSMKIHENPWKSMKIYENQWKSMKINENRWKSMKIEENRWKSMKIIENR